MMRIKEIAWKVTMSLLRISLMLVIGLAIYFRLFEKRLIFYPERVLAGSPHVAFESVLFNAGDGTRLHGWWIPFEGSDRVFIISHGNAGNIGDRYQMGEYVREEFQSSVLMYDYRGYGQSEGEPSEAGLYSDLDGAVAYVHQRGYEPKDIFLVGQSLGTAVTLDVGTRKPVAGIILEAPFSSVRAMARHYMFSMPVDYLFVSRFDSLSKIPNVHVPIAFVHGKGDPVIPFEFAQQLFDATSAPRKFFAVDASIHEGALMALGLARTKELRDFLFATQDRN